MATASSPSGGPCEGGERYTFPSPALAGSPELVAAMDSHNFLGGALEFQPMSESDELFNQALRLPEHDRAELARRLLESLDAGRNDDVDDAWLTEIERRCAAVDAGEAITSDWEDFRQRVEREIFGR
jgi:putative addiction module component (TIGR02574 family)